MMRTKSWIIVLFLLFGVIVAEAQTISEVGLYRLFERSIENTTSYSNKFSGVSLNCIFTAPSGRKVTFMGFFDGDGAGGGDLTTGSIWKIRFLPDEIGQWNYTWSWSDETPGGTDSFSCVSTGSGKGVLRAYQDNPRWMAYNGKEPVWLKSYYESAQGAISQPFDWVTENVYQPMIDRGYNHFLVNFLMPLCCFTAYYTDGPAQTTQDLYLYTEGKASTTMRLDVWTLIERHVGWLNEKNIGLHMFLGFDGSKNSGPSWAKLSDSEKDFYVKYVVARLAPFANIAGWNFLYEVDGSRTAYELGWASLVKKYDVFDHLRTYQDENPGTNEYFRSEYNFAAVENHLMYSSTKDIDRVYWKDGWTHHSACLAGYVPGKPVYMIEGNALWRRYWQPKTGATQDDLRQAAWGCATAGASFTWCGHTSAPLVVYGPLGLPFHGDSNPYAASALQIDILSDVMTRELNFCTMLPADSLLSGNDSKATWCLSEPGKQYLVFSKGGESFSIKLLEGWYKCNQWLNTKTGANVLLPELSISGETIHTFTPPDTLTDWVLLIRATGRQISKPEVSIVSAETDTSGLKVSVRCNRNMIIPDNYLSGFKIKDKGSISVYPIEKISVDVSDSSIIVIELNSVLSKTDPLVLDYIGTLTSTDSSFLAPVAGMIIKSNMGGTFKYRLNQTHFKIYPNPCGDQLYVQSKIPVDCIRIYDFTGRQVACEQDYDSGIQQVISMARLPKGVYVLAVVFPGSTVFEKVIKE